MPVYQSIQDIPEGEAFDTALRTGAERQSPTGGDTVAKIEVNDKNSFTNKKADKTGIYKGPRGDHRYFKASTPLPPGYEFSHERGAAADVEEKATRAKNAKGAPENRATE
jgi:hypothetical protein